MLSLVMVEPGKKVEVVEIRGGRLLAKRLSDMGIYPGVELEVVSNIGQGPVIVAREGNRIGIGLGMAHKIIVKTV